MSRNGSNCCRPRWAAPKISTTSSACASSWKPASAQTQSTKTRASDRTIAMRYVAIAVVIAGCGGDAGTRVDPSWSTQLGTIAPALLGHNAVWSRGGLGIFDESTGAVDSDVVTRTQAI